VNLQITSHHKIPDMKKKTTLFLLAFLFVSFFTSAQKIYKFDTVPGDPLKVRIYTLDNGLKVYMTVYKDAPRIQTAIAVRTGSKNDPHDNTGLSHYLEHMMFKGTEHFGTIDYGSEKPYLDAIENDFEIYKKTRDTVQRKKTYHEIDSLSGVASKFAIANEYDKLLEVIGAKGTNAYTSFEQTVYVNDIPANKVQPWLEIEFDRFKDPVFRLFHTELETVYEEKNMSLDRDDDKIEEALLSGLFQKNTYGTQTTLGSVEHLKNPSLKSLREYYNSRYLPNNMAILMSGDFDPSVVIAEIDALFGQLPSKPLTPYVPAIEDPIISPIVKEVYGPDAESVTFGYRLGGADTRDADLLKIFDMIMSNSQAGLIDLNLNQAQTVLEAGSYGYTLKDYSMNVFYGRAKDGQSLDDVRNLIMEQIERVKRGEFPDWLIPAIINDIKLSNILGSETNSGRVAGMTTGFVQEIPRSKQVQSVERFSKITKQDVMEFAKANYRNNYVIVYKRNGADKSVAKVSKPQISPVSLNRDEESAFLKKILSEPTQPIQPVFLDYSRDLQTLKTRTSVPVVFCPNRENKTFSMYYYFKMGTNTNKAISVALDYLKYLGTSKFSPSQVQEEFYKLGCSFDVSTDKDELWVTLTGLDENMPKATALLEELLSDVQPSPEPYRNLVKDIIKKREDDKLSKSSILWSGMYNFGIYGKKSPFTNIYTETELNDLKPETLVSMIRDLTSYQHEILYYGPENPQQLINTLNELHRVPAVLKPVPSEKKFEQQPTEGTKVFTVDYEMKQAEILMLSRSSVFDVSMIPVTRLFNEYYGGSMNSIVFQEIRESKGLAYSAYAGYRPPAQKDEHFYLFSYIGTQNDKLPEAMKAMMGLFNELPKSEKALNTSKEAIISKIRTERITKSNILFNYINAGKLGLTYDVRKDIFEKVPSMTFEDLKNFHDKYIRNQNFNIMVMGKKGELNLDELKKYGAIQSLSLTDIFGY
jgi:predicted Zn-dependent peptidase